MRKNLPVNDHEHVLLNDDTIVSKTDIKGRITYVNEDFVRISGFSADELIGKPHNIVRHPDMPPEAFADLWNTLQAGKAWTGVVKNRTKTGEFYWVEANAAPIKEEGQVVGYTSVRTKASREQIQAAELAYAEIRQGKTDLVVENGAAVRKNVLNKFYAILDTSIMLRVYAAMSLMSLLFWQ